MPLAFFLTVRLLFLEPTTGHLKECSLKGFWHELHFYLTQTQRLRPLLLYSLYVCCIAFSLTGSKATEQCPLHTGLSELAWGCWLCNKAFNGHTASPCLPGANTKSLFTVACPDVSELSISPITPEAGAFISWLKYT